MKIYLINNSEFYNLTDLLFFLQENYGIDYQNYIIKVSLKIKLKKKFVFIKINLIIKFRLYLLLIN